MSWNLDENQFNTVTALAASQRYSYAIRKIVETQEVWSLCEGEVWAMGQDPIGRQFLPIWPHPDFADRCRAQHWKHHQPRQIDLEAWRQRWIGGIHEAHKFISVFPVPSGGAVMVSPEKLRRDLDYEIRLRRS